MNKVKIALGLTLALATTTGCDAQTASSAAKSQETAVAAAASSGPIRAAAAGYSVPTEYMERAVILRDMLPGQHTFTLRNFNWLIAEHSAGQITWTVESLGADYTVVVAEARWQAEDRTFQARIVFGPVIENYDYIAVTEIIVNGQRLDADTQHDFLVATAGTLYDNGFG